jgi:hypothetical protein
VLRAAETAVERKALEDRIVALRSTPEAINRSQEFALFEAHVRQEESERAAADRQEVRNEFAADIAALNDAIEAGHAKVARLHGRISELDNERVQLTTAIGNAAKEVGVLCEGRAAVDILPDLLANTKHKVAFAAEYATERVQAHIEHAKGRVAEAEAALALLGWTDSYNMMVWARSIAQPVAAARWTKICEAFGFDPEEDPPASIPAILAGDRWTNTRRMLADACAKLRAPSLEVVLGELIQTR